MSGETEARRALEAAAIPAAGLEARWLARAADGDAARLGAMLVRRLAREPLDRILGHRGFWTLDLKLSPDTLSPRPDTETLVSLARDRAPARPALRLLDLGTGTGAILLALLAELPGATGLGTDIAEGAVATARENAAAAGLAGRCTFAAGNWGEGLAGPFDIVVSNPPYIPAAEIAGLEPEVRLHDPLRALDGGPDGLDAYRSLVPQTLGLLAPDGLLVLEIGIGQERDVCGIAAAAGFRHLETRADLAGIARALAFRPALPAPP